MLFAETEDLGRERMKEEKSCGVAEWRTRTREMRVSPAWCCASPHMRRLLLLAGKLLPLFLDKVRCSSAPGALLMPENP